MAREKWDHNWLFRESNGRYKSKTVTVEDDYSEESGGKLHDQKLNKVRLPSDKVDPKSLNGPVIIVKEGRKKDG